MEYFVYILENKDKRHYIGCTSNIKKRLEAHNAGVTRSTKPYRPWKLIYLEKFDSKQGAYKKEWYLKHPKGYQEKLAIIKKHGGFA